MPELISSNLKDNENRLYEKFAQKSDLIIRYFKIETLNNITAFIAFISCLSNGDKINSYIPHPLLRKDFSIQQKATDSNRKAPDIIVQSGLLSPTVTLTTDLNEACNKLLAGDCVLFIEDCPEAVINSIGGWEQRAITDPISDVEIRGARDGFIESVKTNMVMIRRRIRDINLKFESYSIGTRTQTEVVVSYIEGIVDAKILEELKNRLSKIDTDSILESGYLEEFLEDAKFSIFPQILSIERPDNAAALLLEGRIIILTDNTPFALVVPSYFWDSIQAPGDYYTRFYIGSFVRIIRIFALLLSIFLPSLYVMLVSFHHEMIPTPLAMKMAAGREGIPFPAILEAVIMEIMFEVLREAGIRIPKPIGQAVSIVGALVIGESAVQAGIVSPIMVIVVSAAGICSFAVPGYYVSMSLRLLRFPVLFLTSIFGNFGFIVATMAIFMHLVSLRSFGVPYFSPYVPFRAGDVAYDLIIRAPWKIMSKKKRSKTNVT